jgi:hypothetical protein
MRMMPKHDLHRNEIVPRPGVAQGGCRPNRLIVVVSDKFRGQQARASYNKRRLVVAVSM